MLFVACSKITFRDSVVAGETSKVCKYSSSTGLLITVSDMLRPRSLRNSTYSVKPTVTTFCGNGFRPNIRMSLHLNLMVVAPRPVQVQLKALRSAVRTIS